MASITLRRLSFVRVGWTGPYSTPLPASTKNTGSPADLPVRRRVRLHDQATGLLLREMWSDAATGQYQFHGLPAGAYFVIAFDHTGQYGAQVEADIVLPVP